MAFQTHQDYIQTFNLEIQEKLIEFQLLLKGLLPEEANEVISYNMPAFKLKKVIVYFAAHKEHLGFYPTSKPIEAVKEELRDYKYSKGAIQLPYSQPLPVDLIKKIVSYRLKDLGL
jgi:uncharacterized protein YdhG (YjbR/CyaY superfamily)